jgi:hypothetical protein
MHLSFSLSYTALGFTRNCCSCWSSRKPLHRTVDNAATGERIPVPRLDVNRALQVAYVCLDKRKNGERARVAPANECAHQAPHAKCRCRWSQQSRRRAASRKGSTPERSQRLNLVTAETSSTRKCPLCAEVMPV